MLQMGTSKVLTTFPLQIQNSWQLSLLELPTSCVPASNTVTSSTVAPHCNTDFHLGLLWPVYLHCSTYPPILLMQHSRLTLAFKPLMPLLPLLPYHHLLLLTILLRLLLLPPRLSGFFNGMLGISEPGALNCYIFFRTILLTLSVSRKLISTHLPLSIAPTPGLAFSLVMPRTLAAASSFSLRRAYPFLNFLLPLSLLDPYSDYVEVNISLNNSSSLFFLNVYAPPIRSSPTDGRTDSFSRSILSSSTNLFILGDFSCHHPSGT